MARRRRYGSFTPARRAALKKAQAASARKRSRFGAAKAHVGRNKARYAGLVGVAVAGGVLGSRSRSHKPKKKASMGAPIQSMATTRPRAKVDRDAIPLYNPKSSKSWPATNAKQARKRNKKLRKQGMIE